MTDIAVAARKPEVGRTSSSTCLSPSERDELRRRFQRESELRKALADEALSPSERDRLQLELMDVSPYVAEVLRLNFREEDPCNAGLTEADRLARHKQDARRLVDVLSGAGSLAERIEIYRAYGRRLLCLATSWWGDEMPKLNGDWEWLVCCSADFGRRG